MAHHNNMLGCHTTGIVVTILLSIITATGGVPMPTAVRCAGPDVLVDMCDMNIARHKNAPSTHPMFREQVQHYCRAHSEPVPIRELSLMMDKDNVPPAKPAGMVFHMSRCGSTLVGNMFATVDGVTMLTESQPPAQLMGCNLPRTLTVAHLRTLARAMGAATNGRNVIFKFQSALTLHADMFQEAFPDTPMVFLYRNPVEVMASNLVATSFHPHVGRTQAPCTRMMKRPASDFEAVTGFPVDTLAGADPREFCAAYLGYLMTKGAVAVESSKAPAMAIDYATLPDAVGDVIAPLFGVHLSSRARERMDAEGHIYSKARRQSMKEFASDSAAKRDTMVGQPTTWATQYTQQPLARLLQVASPSSSLLPSQPSDTSVEPRKVSKRTHVDASGARVVDQTDDTTDYPHYFPLGDVLDWWNPDVSTIPPDYRRYDTLARFDYSDEKQRAQAEQFRNAELPFVVYNIPSLERVRRKWTDDYLETNLGRKYGVETSHDNHFMYYNKGMSRRRKSSKLRDWHRPTKEEFMTYSEWLEKAERRPLANNDTHYYFRASSGSRSTRFIKRDLKYFNPAHQDSSLFIVDETKQRGIHCRFGMQGIIAESHYDGGRNYISMIRGAKRYILQPPSQCKNLKMLPYPHPSARHSSVDWSNRYVPYERHAGEDNVADAAFDAAATINVVVKEGEALYIPSFWFHYIVSLNTNIQCNSRSGTPPTGVNFIKKCGFRVSADTESNPRADRLRQKFRSDFAEFNTVSPAALYKQRGARAADDVAGSTRRPVAYSEAEIARSRVPTVGAVLASKQAADVAGDPHVRQHSFMRRARSLEMDWIVTGGIGFMVVGMGVMMAVRWRRSFHSRGGSV